MKKLFARTGLTLAVALTSFVACATHETPDPVDDDHDHTGSASTCTNLQKQAASQTQQQPAAPTTLQCGSQTDECQSDLIGAAAGCGFVWVRPCITQTVLVEEITPDPNGEGVSQCGVVGPPVPLAAKDNTPTYEPGSLLVNDDPLSPCKQKAMDAYLKCMEDSAAKRAADTKECDDEWNKCVADGAPVEGCNVTYAACIATTESEDILRVAGCSLSKANAFLACDTGINVKVIAKPVKKLGGWILKQFE